MIFSLPCRYVIRGHDCVVSSHTPSGPLLKSISPNENSILVKKFIRKGRLMSKLIFWAGILTALHVTLVWTCLHLLHFSLPSTVSLVCRGKPPTHKQNSTFGIVQGQVPKHRQMAERKRMLEGPVLQINNQEKYLKGVSKSMSQLDQWPSSSNHGQSVWLRVFYSPRCCWMTVIVLLGYQPL